MNVFMGQQAKPGLRSALIWLSLGSDLVVFVLWKLGPSDWSIQIILIRLCLEKVKNI